MVLQFDDLIKSVQAFSERWHRHATDFFAYTTLNIRRLNRSSTNINSSFLFSQLLVDLLLRMKPLETDREDFCVHCIKICQKKYGNNENEVYLKRVLEQIREFQVDIYSTQTALRWYTKSAFLYDIVNNSFRTNDVETIFHSRFVIREMHQQLMKRQIDSAIRVYRGQRMSNTEAELLGDSIGKLVSMKSFLSTSLDLIVAEIFAGIESSNTDEEIAFVIFIIDAIPSESNKTLRPFGDITDISYFATAEQEILFMVGSVFRITNVAQDLNRRWIISMTMCDQEDIELNKIFSWVKDEQNINGTDGNPYYDFAALLLAMGKLDEAQNFCHNLLHEYSLFPPKNNELATCYYMLGKAAVLLGLEKSYNSGSEIAPDLEKLYRDKHTKNDQNRNYFACFSWAKSKFFKDRRYLHSASSPLTSLESSHFVESLQCFEKALANIDKTAANYHFLVGSIHHLQANAYRTLTDFKRALVYYEMALVSYSKSIGMTHRLIAELYADFGRMYLEKKHLRKALDYHQRALDVAQRVLPDAHPEMGIFHMGLAVVYAEMGQNDQALLHIDAVVSIDLTSFPNGKPPLSSYYAALDMFYEHKESLNTFQTNRDNIPSRRTIQPPTIKRSRLPRPEAIFYLCPWCHQNVWIYRAFVFCKGSPCFQCLSGKFTLRSPQTNPNITLYLDYLIGYHGPIERNERLCFFAHELRRNYLEAPTGDDSTSSN